MKVELETDSEGEEGAEVEKDDDFNPPVARKPP